MTWFDLKELSGSPSWGEPCRAAGAPRVCRGVLCKQRCNGLVQSGTGSGVRVVEAGHNDGIRGGLLGGGGTSWPPAESQSSSPLQESDAVLTSSLNVNVSASFPAPPQMTPLDYTFRTRALAVILTDWEQREVVMATLLATRLCVCARSSSAVQCRRWFSISDVASLTAGF